MTTFRRRAHLVLLAISDVLVALVNALDTVGGWINPKPWGVFEEDSGVHVVPIRDDIPHDLASLDCVCGPKVEWEDPESGETYPNGPLLTHHSLDGREAAERIRL